MRDKDIVRLIRVTVKIMGLLCGSRPVDKGVARMTLNK